MPKYKTRRKVSNIIVDPGALLRISIPFIILAFIAVTVVISIHWQALQALEQAASSTNENPELLETFKTIVTNMLVTGMIGLGILDLVCLILWVIYSHRIFGPTVPIRRHIKSLKNGDYKARITLRKRDELKDVATELNELAETLETLKGQGA